MASTSSKFAGINLACGGKLCREDGWINADHSPSTAEVIRINLLRPFPFREGSFDVVYHSQFIEHLPAELASMFLRECFRILKPKGVLRVVTPDLENQALEYLKYLQAVKTSPQDSDSRRRYEWIRLEMLDQLTRHASGGAMVEFLRTSGSESRDYLIERMGRSGENLIPQLQADTGVSLARRLVRAARHWSAEVLDRAVPTASRVGRFRLSGEPHLCMYDEYLLKRLFVESGFIDVARVGAKESRIANWNATLLDCDILGKPDCEVSLFMECAKPA